jgi:predicted RecA/RadA family phage recombinase
MKNFVQPGKNMTVVAPVGGVESGLPYLVGSLVGVATGSHAAGESYEMALEGVFELPKAGATVIAHGAKVGWDATGKLVVAAGAGDFDIGHAFAAAGNGPTKVQVKILGFIDVDTDT